MDIVLSVLSGFLFATGIYLLLRRSIVKLVLGLVLLGHAANLAIFTAGGVLRGAVPIIAKSETVLPPGSADPLPQALILTAIVIGFGVQAFAIVLIKRAVQTVGADDLDDMTTTDK